MSTRCTWRTALAGLFAAGAVTLPGMRRFIVVPAVLLVLVAMPAVASAQGAGGPPTFRDRLTDEFTLTDFCGTGESVEVVQNIVGNGWETEDGFRMTFRTHWTYTYGDNTLLEIDAGRLLAHTVATTPEGGHTDQVVQTGISAALRAPGGGVLTQDHGYLEFLTSFNENNEFEGSVLLKEAGGHPVFENGVFCDFATEALGIPTT
jgi:hypothetical protein